MARTLQSYITLLGINLIYACTSIFTKMASLQEFPSWAYLLWIAGAVAVMGVYAILWQQGLKRTELSLAYMFKGTSLIFGLIIARSLLGEQITRDNIFGAVIIIIGIALFAKT